MDGLKALLASSKGNVFALCSGAVLWFASQNAVDPKLTTICLSGLGLGYMVTRAWEERGKR